ncbi:hypothetical protein ACHQM5_010300 [Ranunculus cassubicifolius]
MSYGGGGVDEGMIMEELNRVSVLMWGYLPGVSPQRSPLLSPVQVHLPSSNGATDLWKDVSGGGCGFAMAISESGKLITWGSTDDMGLSYVTAGRHGEIPEAFPLPTDASIVKAAAGWAHCVSATVNGEVYTWGWKECVPTGKVLAGGGLEKDQLERNCSLLNEQGTPTSQVVKYFGFESRGVEENTKRRRISSAKQAAESSSSNDETEGALPCLVSLNPGIRVVSVAAGGRHTIVLSDIGQVWGWGYGGEGQLGLGSRIRMVSSPHPVPCFEGQISKVPGSYIKSIACGGRHSVVLTDAGALLAFGWGLYGQCGQGSTDDELSPTCISSLLGIPIGGVAAGLWHTVCVSAEGDVYSFGGNQFGQLGTGTDQAETLPRLLDAPSIEDKHAKIVSCGARHTAVITDEGDVFCWGWNKYGQLGLGDVIDRNIPCQVPGITGYYVPNNVACGWWHTLLLAQSPT